MHIYTLHTGPPRPHVTSADVGQRANTVHSARLTSPPVGRLPASQRKFLQLHVLAVRSST